MANNKSFVIKNGLLAGRYLGSNGTETAGTVGYSLTGASLTTSFSVATQETSPKSVALSSDGTKMFVLGFSGDDINEYTLSTAWDVSTASFVDSFSVAGQMTAPFGMEFKPDGTRVFVVGNNTDTVFQYSLSAAWDISSANYDSKSFSFATQDNSPYDITFNTNGTKMYMCGRQNDLIYQYSLSTAWDVSTASYDSVTFDPTAAEGEFAPHGIHMTDSNTKIFFWGGLNVKVYRLDLSTAGDLSTASWSGYGLSVSDNNSGTPFVADNGTKMYITGAGNDTVYQYSTTSYTQSLDLSTGNTFSFTPSGATTVSFTNPPASGLAIGFTLEVVNTGGYTLTWPSSVKWHGATTPTATYTKELYSFITTDGGTTYYGRRAAESIQ